MFGKNFYANRSILDNEFIQANFDPSTGLAPKEIDMRLKELFDQKIENTSTAILRAEMFAFLYDNVQIEINEKNLFAAKINHQKVFCKYTNLFKKHILSHYSPQTLDLQKEAVGWGCRPCIDYHHTLPNWNDIHSLGFPGLLDRAKKRQAEAKAHKRNVRMGKKK